MLPKADKETSGLRQENAVNTKMTTEGLDEPARRVAALREASVDVDLRRAGQLVCLVALVAAGMLLLATGVQKNAQITRLREQGVPLKVKVTGCIGLMGGSGSNVAGYNCKATFTLEGRRHNDDLPGTTLYAPGTWLQAIVVPGDPRLLSTPRGLAAEHASGCNAYWAWAGTSGQPHFRSTCSLLRRTHRLCCFRAGLAPVCKRAPRARR